METKLSLSCETFALLKTPNFISAFPSYILFGETISNIKYKENKFLKINFHEAHKVLMNIFYIGSFLSSELDYSKGIILKKPEEVYYWNGLTLQTEDRIEKYIKIGIEKQSEFIFEILFSAEEFNNFLFLFKRCLLASLCLKEEEEQFIIKTVETQTCETILAAKTDAQKIRSFIDQFFNNSFFEKPLKLSTFTEIFIYYNDIILILKQLASLTVESEDNSAIILANL